MTTWSDLVDREKDLRAQVEEEESEESARSRMLPDELAEDDQYRALVERRAQPLKERGKRAAWGTWKKKAGSVARRQRSGQ